MVLNTEWAQVEVIELINDGSGLAFGIIGGRSTGVVVKTILPGGVADRDGRLQSGDHILQIGEVNLRGLGSEQVASVLRQCGIHVRMVVARPVESTSPDYQCLGHAPIVPTKILGDPVELDRHLVENGYPETSAPRTHPSAYSNFLYWSHQPADFGVDGQEFQLIANQAAPHPIRDAVIGHTLAPLPETETYTVDLKKDDLGLGITVAGYVCEREEISGIFVKSIGKGSAADLNHKIKINDRIIEVDGISVVGHTNHQAVEVLRCSGSFVTIRFERYLRGPKYEQLQQAIRANELRPHSPPTSTLSSLPQVPLSHVCTYMDIEPEGTSIDFDSAVIDDENNEKEIVFDDCGQSHQFSVDSKQQIYEKWCGKLQNKADIVIAQMEKEANKGLGISLEGTVDVEDGKEVRPHHYIRNILPDGPVGRVGVLHAGDELLEVNGLQLMGLNHLEVVAILKRLPNFVSLVCARYAVPIGVIDTSQHRAAFQARKILAGSLQTLIPGECMVKAKSETSLGSSFTSDIFNESRSRSLEVIAGLPMWSGEPTEVELIKGDYGLGFSILDYQDPLNPQETVIVIRSLVPGGVAQTDGRLVPGDRLLAVNRSNVENATLDKAVQVLKGAPKGLVAIRVAKPISAYDAGSHTSQFIRKILQEWSDELEYLIVETEEEEEDHTCLEDFQECIEEYQECLEVVHICIDDSNSSIFNQSPCTSHIDLLMESAQNNHNNTNCLDNNTIQTTTTATITTNRNIINSSLGDSDLDLSYKSTNNDYLNNKIECDNRRHASTPPQPPKALKKTDSFSDRDGYETCVDESLSDEPPNNNNPTTIDEEITPTNSKLNVWLADDNPDEFFLVQFPPVGMPKSLSDPSVPPKRTFRLFEYYNDYKDCLDSYNVGETAELADEAIFGGLRLPPKSRSAPDVMDGSFVTLTYDPGPGRVRRPSHFSEGGVSMTVIRADEAEIAALKNRQVGEMLQKHWGSTHTVKVERGPNASLGISIVGGKVDLESAESAGDKVLGIFVKNVVPESPAGRTGLFKTGDRILEVSGVNLRQESHQKAVEAIRNASNPVTFVIQSLIPWKYENVDNISTNHQKNNECNNCESPFPVDENDKQQQQHPGHSIPEITISNEREKNNADETIPVTEDIITHHSPDIKTSNDEEVANRVVSSDDDDEEEEEEDMREMEGRTVSKLGQPIDRASAANLKRSQEDIDKDTETEDDFGYTTNKVKKKYSSLGHTILMVQLERSSQGLGLSLAGHKDRSCMAVFVCGLNPNGAAYKTGGIQIGDEILEVNGVVLHGRCHLNASAIIKGLSGPIFKVIILRRKTALDDIAVKPLTQFPVSLAEEASEEQFSATYPNVRTVTVKKGNQSLGIMIIEGKHAEVGQGIFISDIQEGSFAEKAGLEIGEMILAVNKDSLVGSNYDTAANLLKRTEGLVTLVVSNPGKKDAQAASLQPNSNAADRATLKSGGLKPASGPPSRPTTPVPVDHATCAILPGKDTVIEVFTDGKRLGIFFVGGKDTLMPNGVTLVEVYPGGAAEKDGRLQPGDQIMDVNGTAMKDITYNTASQALRQTLPKMKLTIYRPEKLEFTKIDIELVKKPGKGLGLSVIAKKSGKGVYIADIISGGIADVDGRLMRGDLLVSVNGQNVENAGGDEAGAILKTVTGRVSLSLHRYKTLAR